MTFVGLFGRKRADADPDTAAQAGDVSLEPERESQGVDPAEEEWEPETPFSRLRGPFDRSEAILDDTRIDLGSLWISVAPDVQVALQVDEGSGTPVGVQLTKGSSGAYLQAYAAPRTEGIWADIRTEIAQSVVAAGGRADIIRGTLGKEVRLHQRGGAPLRLLGVDGPRWFLRALLSGPAATDDRAADELIQVVRATVVDRGAAAMAPREPLPLRLPFGPSQDADAESPEQNSRPSYGDLRPFDRGPEISEVH